MIYNNETPRLRRAIIAVVATVTWSMAPVLGLSASSYLDGLRAAQAGNFQGAISSLQTAYAAKADALTAYVLAVCYAHVDNYDATLNYGLAALEAQPPLSSQYVQPAKDLLSWARAAIEAAPAIAMTTTSETGVAQGTTDVNYMRGAASNHNVSASNADPLKARLRPFIDVDQIDRQAAASRASSACSSRVSGCRPDLQQSSATAPPPPAPLPNQ
jgi:tetratricopeptide (TPR) repeat protein